MRHVRVPFLVVLSLFFFFTFLRSSFAEEIVQPYMSAFKMGMTKNEVSEILDKKFKFKLGSGLIHPKFFPTDKNPYGSLTDAFSIGLPPMPGLEMFQAESKESLVAPRHMAFIFADDRLIQTYTVILDVSTFALRDKIKESYGGNEFSVGTGISTGKYFSAETAEFKILLDVQNNGTNNRVYYFALDSDNALNRLIEKGKNQEELKKKHKLEKLKL